MKRFPFLSRQENPVALGSKLIIIRKFANNLNEGDVEMSMADTVIKTIFNNAFHSGGLKNLSPADAFKACQLGAILIDVREDYLTDYKRFDVPYFKLCPLSRIDEWQNDLPRENGLIFADATGLRSHEAIQKLMDTGSTTLFNLAGGLVEWERSGLPVKTDIKERLTGSCMCQLKPRERKKS